MCLWRFWEKCSLPPSLFFIFWNRHCGSKLPLAFFFYTKRSRLGERGGVLALPTIFQAGWDWVRFVPEYFGCTWALDQIQTTSQPFLELLPSLSWSKKIAKKICSVDCHTTKLQTPACWVWCEWGAIFPKSQWPNNKTAMTSIIFLIIIINPAFPIA